MYVPTTNVIPYGINMLVFHGTMTYNEKGEPIGQSKSAGSKLTSLIKKVIIFIFPNIYFFFTI